MHLGRAREWRVDIAIVAQRIAGRPQIGIAGAAERPRLRVEIWAKGNAACGAEAVRSHADGVTVGCLDPGAGRCRIIGELALVAHHRRSSRLGEHRIVVTAGLRTALRQDHPALWVEGDAGDLAVRGQPGDVEFPPRRAEAAIGIDAHRPDRLPHGIEQPAAIDREAVDFALRLGEAPGLRILAVERRIGNGHLAAVIGDRRETVRRSAGDAVVERIDDDAVRRQPVDQPGIEVGNKELRAGRIVHQVAQPGAAIGGDGGEQRDFAGAAIDFPDAAGIALSPAGAAPLAGHERCPGRAALAAHRLAVGIRHYDVEAEGRGGREIDVWRRRAAELRRIVERHPEGLPDIGCAGRKHRLGRNQLAGRRPVRLQLLDDHGAAGRIDEGVVERLAAHRRRRRWDDAREAGDHRLAGREDRLVRRQGEGCGDKSKDSCDKCADELIPGGPQTAKRRHGLSSPLTPLSHAFPSRALRMTTLPRRNTDGTSLVRPANDWSSPAIPGFQPL